MRMPGGGAATSDDPTRSRCARSDRLEKPNMSNTNGCTATERNAARWQRNCSPMPIGA